MVRTRGWVPPLTQIPRLLFGLKIHAAPLGGTGSLIGLALYYKLGGHPKATVESLRYDS